MEIKKIKKIFFISVSIFLLILVEIPFGKSSLKSNWKIFSVDNLGIDNQKMMAGWNGKRLVVRLKPLPGEGGYSLAKRVLNKKSRSLKTIKKYSKSKRLLRNRYITFPVKVLKSNILNSALKAVFFKDNSKNNYWEHRVTYAWETTTLIAGLFTKKGIKASHLVRYNKMSKNGNILKKGDIIKIPWKWISPALSLRKITLKPPLKLKKDRKGNYFAHYQMKSGETLYSSVVIRFTGRLLNDEVNLVAKKLLKLNSISDAKLIQSRQKIKIPIELLSEEYIAINEKNVSIEKSPKKKKIFKKKSPKKKKIFKKKGNLVISKNKSDHKSPKIFSKIHVILDSGHGGGDPGAKAGSRRTKDLIYEDEVVYDVSKRISKIFKKYGVVVHPTLSDPNQKKPVRFLSNRHDKDEQLLVTPRYSSRNSRIGANMRVYLVNHIFKKLIKQKVPAENILFISLHGDSLHSSLSGVMVYYADHRLRRSRFGLRNNVYRRIKEYNAKLTFRKKDNKFSERLSKSFGKIIVNEFQKQNLRTHRVSSAVRGHLYRRGKKTLPAVLRYSKVPTSVLVEIANLNNRRDRQDLLKSKTRQRMASAIANSVFQKFEVSKKLLAQR